MATATLWLSSIAGVQAGYPIFVEDDAQFGRVQISVVTRGGSGKDPTDRMGLMSYLARGVLRGTVTRPYTEIQRLFSELGIEVGLRVERQTVRWEFRFPVSSLSSALDLMEDLFTQPRFDPREMNQVQTQLRGELRNRMMDPGFMAAWSGAKGALAEGPFVASELGRMESIARLTPQDATKAFRSEVHRGNVAVGIVAPSDSQRVREMVQARLSFLQASQSSPSQTQGLRTPVVRRGVLVETPGGRRGEVLVRFFVPLDPKALQQEGVSRVAVAWLRGLASLDLAEVKESGFERWGSNVVLGGRVSIGELGGFAERLFARIRAWSGGEPQAVAQFEGARQAAIEVVRTESNLPPLRLLNQLFSWSTGLEGWSGAQVISEISSLSVGQVLSWIGSSVSVQGLSLATVGNLDEMDAVVRALSFVQEVEAPLASGSQTRNDRVKK